MAGLNERLHATGNGLLGASKCPGRAANAAPGLPAAPCPARDRHGAHRCPNLALIQARSTTGRGRGGQDRRFRNCSQFVSKNSRQKHPRLFLRPTLSLRDSEAEPATGQRPPRATPAQHVLFSLVQSSGRCPSLWNRDWGNRQNCPSSNTDGQVRVGVFLADRRRVQSRESSQSE